MEDYISHSLQNNFLLTLSTPCTFNYLQETYLPLKGESFSRRKHTRVVSISPGDRLISSGEVKEERVVRGVRGEGSVSQALYPLGGGVGI